MKQYSRKSKRHGSAMLDVVAASVLTAIVMVPSMNIMRRSQSVIVATQLRQEMATTASSIVEQQMADVAVRFRSRKTSGKKLIGNDLVRYSVVRSDQSALGGIPGRLMGISVTVWHDENRNRRVDTDESKYNLFTKVAIQ